MSVRVFLDEMSKAIHLKIYREPIQNPNKFSIHFLFHFISQKTLELTLFKNFVHNPILNRFISSHPMVTIEIF
jgi:ADP-dependent phosphofructokinase/glucokinase